MRIITSKVVFTDPTTIDDQPRGFEHQRYVFHDDETISLAVFSVAKDKGITRDVIINFDPFWRPIDSYVRIHLGSRLEGSGWFRFTEDAVSADIWNHTTGLDRQSVSVSPGAIAFGAHPIATDMVIAAAYDRGTKESIQLLPNVFLSSKHHFGATGPEIAPVRLQLEYLGRERISAAGSTFDTDRWRILEGNELTAHNHPGEVFWTLQDSFVFVRAEIPSTGYKYLLSQIDDVST
ncbi:MAG: hypothetical protein ACI87W_001161 [Halieaceae bacterium]|jgi:hypothetical protein